MFEFFEKMRKKPKTVRDQFAFAVAIGATLVVTVVWSLSLPARFEMAAQQTDNAADAARPFSSLISQLREQTSQVIDSVKDSQSQLESESSELSPEAQADGFDLQAMVNSTSSSAQANIATTSTTTVEIPPVVREVRIATSSAQATTSAETE